MIRRIVVAFLVVCFAGWQVGGSFAQAAVQTKGEEAFDAHAPTIRYHFADSDMDFNFGFILGTTSNHGCEIGEAFYVAGQIKDGDASSWQAEWGKMADRLKARADAALLAGHKSSACRELQRASYYYRAGIVSMLSEDKQRISEAAAKSRNCLVRAGELMDPPLEYIEVPFEGKVLPGFFRRGIEGVTPNKTLVMIGGGETFAEDLWFHIGPQAFERGYNFITVDLPGQGLLPWQGRIFRADMNRPISAVIDYALRRPEVDAERLAVYGISGGGGFVPQAAMHDDRIKAVAVTAAVVDAKQLFSTMPVATTTPEVMKTFSSFHRNVVKAVAYRWGVKGDDIPGLVAANEGFSFDPSKVLCPALILVGAGEYEDKEVRKQQNECIEKLPNPMKKLIVTPFDTGASSHCMPENRSLMGEILFDWFDEVLK